MNGPFDLEHFRMGLAVDLEHATPHDPKADIDVRITPVTDVDVDEMLRSLKTWPLFEGYRGQPPLDGPALRSLLYRISAMLEDLPDIAELDLNPVLVADAGKGCITSDARIRMTRPQPKKPLGARTTRQPM